MEDKELEKLREEMGKMIQMQNSQGIPEFEGYSPDEMKWILYGIFDEECPVQLLKLSDTDYQKIPILNQIKHLLKIIVAQGELKLTSKGFLPTKIVADIYSQGFIKDRQIESGISKLYKETDSSIISLTRILIEISGLAKKRHNKLSLTKKGKAIIGDDSKLLLLIFKIFGNKFNWAYFDGYGQNKVGQLGFGFSLLLFSKYGSESRPENFYADKYFEAFPNLRSEVSSSYFGPSNESSNRCYTVRTFHRFLDFFGLTNLENEGFWDKKKQISKTALFDSMVQVFPPDQMAKA